MLIYQIYKTIPSYFDILYHQQALSFNFIIVSILNSTLFFRLSDFRSFLSHYFFDKSFIFIFRLAKAAKLFLQLASFFGLKQGISDFTYIDWCLKQIYIFIMYIHILFIQILRNYSNQSFKFLICCLCHHFSNQKLKFIFSIQYADF